MGFLSYNNVNIQLYNFIQKKNLSRIQLQPKVHFNYFLKGSKFILYFQCHSSIFQLYTLEAFLIDNHLNQEIRIIDFNHQKQSYNHQNLIASLQATHRVGYKPLYLMNNNNFLIFMSQVNLKIQKLFHIMSSFLFALKNFC